MSESMLALEPPDEGVLFVVTGPSGVGKSTLIRCVMASVPGLAFSISATTRAPRPGEMDGRDYHFLTPERFGALLQDGAFLEHATVYDRSYGTLRDPVVASLREGQSVLLDIDVQGARQVKATFPACVRIFLLPPALSALEERLRRRGDPEDILIRRMAQCGEQLRGAPEFDYIVVNDRLEVAKTVLTGIFLAELARTHRRRKAVGRVLGELAIPST